MDAVRTSKLSSETSKSTQQLLFTWPTIQNPLSSDGTSVATVNLCSSDSNLSSQAPSIHPKRNIIAPLDGSHLPLRRGNYFVTALFVKPAFNSFAEFG